eukprot:4574357-Ditylum_brightwellii.AAC.1
MRDWNNNMFVGEDVSKEEDKAVGNQLLHNSQVAIWLMDRSLPPDIWKKLLACMINILALPDMPTDGRINNDNAREAFLADKEHTSLNTASTLASIQSKSQMALGKVKSLDQIQLLSKILSSMFNGTVKSVTQQLMYVYGCGGVGPVYSSNGRGTEDQGRNGQAGPN